MIYSCFMHYKIKLWRRGEPNVIFKYFKGLHLKQSKSFQEKFFYKIMDFLIWILGLRLDFELYVNKIIKHEVLQGGKQPHRPWENGLTVLRRNSHFFSAFPPWGIDSI